MATNNGVNVGLSGATGTGNFVGSNSPTLVTPALGTPASGVLSSCTGFPYDMAFNGGFDSAGAATDCVAQPYGQLVAARSGSFVGESGYLDTAATGQALIVDIRKNGTTIYSVLPQFAATSNTMTGGTLKTDGTEDFVAGDRITFQITQIGSGTAGAGCRFTVRALLT